MRSRVGGMGAASFALASSVSHNLDTDDVCDRYSPRQVTGVQLWGTIISRGGGVWSDPSAAVS